MVPHHLSVVVSTVSHDTILWLALAMPSCDNLTWCISVTRLRCRCWTIWQLGSLFLISFVTSSADIVVLSRHKLNLVDDLIISQMPCQSHWLSSESVHQWVHLTCILCSVHLLQFFAEFLPPIVSTPPPCVIAITSLGIQIIVVWVHLSFHLQVQCCIFSTYASWLCQWSLAR